MSIRSDQQKSHALTFLQQLAVSHTHTCGTVYSGPARGIGGKMEKLPESSDSQITECRVTSSDILHQRHFLYISRTQRQGNHFFIYVLPPVFTSVWYPCLSHPVLTIRRLQRVSTDLNCSLNLSVTVPYMIHGKQAVHRFRHCSGLCVSMSILPEQLP